MEESLTRQKISALESLEAYIKDDINARSAGDYFTVNVIIKKQILRFDRRRSARIDSKC